MAIHLFEQRHHLRFATDIGLHRDSFAAFALNGARYGLGGWLVPEIVDADGETAAGGKESRGTADSAAASGDNYNWGSVHGVSFNLRTAWSPGSHLVEDRTKMNFATELAALFRRDLTRLIQQLEAFPNDQILWQCAPGITNSAGNLVLHLEGNLREFVGRQLGGVPYTRVRSEEFAAAALPAGDLIKRMEAVQQLVPEVISALSAEQLEATYPEDVLGTPLSTQQFLMSLLGHFNYHLGQIDYARRILSHGTAVAYAGL